MFVVKPRITAFLCLLIVLADASLLCDSIHPHLQIVICILLTLLATAVGVSRRSITSGIACVALVGLAIAYLKFTIDHERETDIGWLTGRRLFCYGTVCDTRVSSNERTVSLIIDVRKVIRPSSPQSKGKALITIGKTRPLANQIKKGDHLFMYGSLHPPYRARFPWDFDERGYFDYIGVSCRFIAAAENGLVHIPCTGFTEQTPFGFLEEVRNRIIALHRAALGKRDGDFLSSIVIGNRNVALDPDITQPFRNLGLSHLVAASGFNLTIVVAVTWLILRCVIKHRVALNFAAWLMLACYVQIAGLSPSIQRAAFMSSVLLLADCFTRRCYVLATIGLALVVTVMLDPGSLTDVGLQLSYCATIGLILGCKYVQPSTLTKSVLLMWIIESSAGVVMAQLSVLPLQLKYFMQLGLLALPANLMVAPLVPLITVSGFAVSALTCVFPRSGDWVLILLDKVAGAAVWLLLAGATWMNSVPWAVIPTGQPATPPIFCYYAALILLLRCRARGAQLLTAFISLVASTACLLYRPPLPSMTVICMPEAIVLIDRERRCLVLAERETLRSRRTASFFACLPSYSGQRKSGIFGDFEWKREKHDTTIADLRSGKIVFVRGLDVYISEGSASMTKQCCRNHSVVITQTRAGEDFAFNNSLNELSERVGTER
jgi:ComEC/Rec2-related protein